ncbi:MAG: hypothetical protein GY808_00300 [Gammaproteobacteria bacterium]|nr:hypothetical protein [Gammaproteobacteria bacterium]
MQIILFTLVAAALYVVSDSIVKAIEKHRGEVLPNRSIIFFIIIMTLALVTFNLIETYGPEVGLLPEPNVQQETTKPGGGN